MMTELLLLLILVIVTVAAVSLSHQSEMQHTQICELLDALAEMVGEAIDQKERD